MSEKLLPFSTYDFTTVYRLMKQRVWPVPENSSLFKSLGHPIEHRFSIPVPAFLLIVPHTSLVLARYELSVWHD